MTSQGVELRSVAVGYGHMRVISDVSFIVRPGEIVGLLGRNGAGKTTTVLTVGGLLRDQFAGSITVDGTDVTKTRPWRLPAMGLSIVLEGRRVFREMTVRENLRLAGFAKRKKFDVNSGMERALDLFPALRDAVDKPVALLSGGQQQMVAIGQALVAQPQYVFLDEPCAGLAPVLAQEVYTAVEALRQQGCGVLVIEQDVERIRGLVDRVCLLEEGTVLLEQNRADMDLELIERIIMGNEFVQNPLSTRTE